MTTQWFLENWVGENTKIPLKSVHDFLQKLDFQVSEYHRTGCSQSATIKKIQFSQFLCFCFLSLGRTAVAKNY